MEKLVKLPWVSLIIGGFSTFGTTVQHHGRRRHHRRHRGEPDGDGRGASVANKAAHARPNLCMRRTQWPFWFISGLKCVCSDVRVG